MADETKVSTKASEAKHPEQEMKRRCQRHQVQSQKPKGKRKSVPEAHLYVHAGYNNTLVSVAEPNGNVITWATSGSVDSSGARSHTIRRTGRGRNSL